MFNIKVDLSDLLVMGDDRADHLSCAPPLNNLFNIIDQFTNKEGPTIFKQILLIHY